MPAITTTLELQLKLELEVAFEVQEHSSAQSSASWHGLLTFTLAEPAVRDIVSSHVHFGAKGLSQGLRPETMAKQPLRHSTPLCLAAAASAAAAGGTLFWSLHRCDKSPHNSLKEQKRTLEFAFDDLGQKLGLATAEIQQLQAQLNARQDQQVVLNILVQDSAEELSRLAGRLREAQAEGMAKDQAISQYKQSGPELALQEAIIAKEQEQVERSAEALLSSEPALAQLHAKRATATAPEVEKARALSLQRAELKNAEVALQALCTQRQQDAEKVQRDFAAREQSLLQDRKQQQIADKARLATLKKKLQAHEEVIQGLQSQVGQLETQKIFDDKALQALQVDLESACKSAQDAKRESTGLRKESSSLDRKYSKLQQELSSTTQVMAEARASNARVLQATKVESAKLQKQLAEQSAALEHANQVLADVQDLHAKSAADAQKKSALLQKQLDQKVTDLRSVNHDMADLQKNAHKESTQLQKQLDLTVTEIGRLRQEVTSLHLELDQTKQANAQEVQDAVEQTTSLRQQLDAAQEAKIAALQENEVMFHQLAQKGTEVTAEETTAEQKLASLQQVHANLGKMAQQVSDHLHRQLVQGDAELTAARQALLDTQAAHESAVKEAHKGSTKLQKQLVQKDMDLESVREELAHAQQELTQAVNGKDEALRALEEWEERQEAASRREGALEGKVQALEARLAATEASLQSHRHSGPSSSGIPRPPGLTKLESPSQGSHISNDTPFGAGVPATPSSPKLSPSASVNSVQRTGGLMSFEQAYSARGSKLPGVKEATLNMLRIAQELCELHAQCRVHQAVHQDSVLVRPDGRWQLAAVDRAVFTHISLDHAPVLEGVEAPEMARHLLDAGYYYPCPTQDMYAFGLLLYHACEGQLPTEHLNALSKGTTLRYASKLRGRDNSISYQRQVEDGMRQARLNQDLVKVVLGCLEKEPNERFSAQRVVVDLEALIRKKRW